MASLKHGLIWARIARGWAKYFVNCVAALGGFDTSAKLFVLVFAFRFAILDIFELFVKPTFLNLVHLIHVDMNWPDLVILLFELDLSGWSFVIVKAASPLTLTPATAP